MHPIKRKKKRKLFNLEEIMCVSICSLMWARPTTCGPLMYDKLSYGEKPQEEGGREGKKEPAEERREGRAIPSLC